MKVNNYGDLISQVTGQELIAYEEYGSYQGDYLVITKLGDEFSFWKDSYGSCSGCDWLEGAQDWKTGEVNDKEAKEYVDRPFLTVNIAVLKEIVDKGELQTLLPKNTRIFSDAGWEDCKFSDFEKLVKESLK